MWRGEAWTHCGHFATMEKLVLRWSKHRGKEREWIWLLDMPLDLFTIWALMSPCCTKNICDANTRQTKHFSCFIIYNMKCHAFSSGTALPWTSTLFSSWYLCISVPCDLIAMGASEKLACYVWTVPQVCLPRQEEFSQKAVKAHQSPSPPSQGPHLGHTVPVCWVRESTLFIRAAWQAALHHHSRRGEGAGERDALWEKHLPQGCSLKPWWCYQYYHQFSVTAWSHVSGWGHLRCYRKSFFVASNSQGYSDLSLVDLFALMTGMTDKDSLSQRSASPLPEEFPLRGKRAQTANNTTSNGVSQASPKVQRGRGSPNYLMGRSKPAMLSSSEVTRPALCRGCAGCELRGLCFNHWFFVLGPGLLCCTISTALFTVSSKHNTDKTLVTSPLWGDVQDIMQTHVQSCPINTHHFSYAHIMPGIVKNWHSHYM